LESIPFKRKRPTKKDKQHICLDKGYQGEEVEDACNEFLYTMHLRPRGEEKKQLKKGILKKARRWVVERTHSWMNRFRGVLIRWCKKAENYLAMLHFACGIITWRAIFA
jgi:transposase